MKKLRKGFTLVELLVVIAILGALSATMTSSMQNSTSSAKASAILSNISSAKQAGVLYFSDHVFDDSASAANLEFTSDTLKSGTDAGGYIDIDKFASTNTKYKASGTKGLANAKDWVIVCDFNGEPDAKEIAAILIKNPALKDVVFEANKYCFSVTVLDGRAALATF